MVNRNEQSWVGFKGCVGLGKWVGGFKEWV